MEAAKTIDAVAIRDEGIFASLGVEHTVTSLTLPLTLAYEDYEAIGEFIGMVQDASKWWLGEWLLQGEHLFGDKIAQAAEKTGRAAQTLINTASICRRVPPDRRNPSLSFSAHAEVAALEPAEQKSWLKVAENERLTTAELRSRIKDEGPDVQEREVCPTCQRPL